MNISSRRGVVALVGLVLLLAAGVFGLGSPAGAAPAGVLPAGWAAGGSASSPQSQVTADTSCGANSVLLFSARGSGDVYGAPFAKNKVGAWTQGAGIVLIKNGWNVRDLQAIYPAPPVPSFSKIAAAVIAGGGLSVKSAAAVALITKQFRDAVSNSWRSVQAELEAAYQRCPSRKILLAGYSQGAILLRYIVPRLDAKILKQVVSVDLFADPTEQRAVDSKLQHPAGLDGKLTTEGLDTLSGSVLNGGSFRQTAYPTAISGRTFQYCVDGDLVCDVNLSNLNPTNIFNEGKIHASYGFELNGIRAAQRVGKFGEATQGEHAIQVVGGWSFTCALTDAGGVMCWGANDRGQLGDGTRRDRSRPAYVVGLRTGVVALSAGEQHVCALTRASGAKCWGKGLTGQLGDGHLHISTRPVDVIGLTSGVASVSAGGEHSCALLVNGSARCWGEAGNGQFARGFNPDVPEPVPVVAGFPNTIVDLFAGSYHTCMRTRAGGVLCVGNNGASELGYGQRNASSIVPLPVPGLERGVRLLATHFANSCAVLLVNTVYCWGGFGQQDPPRPLPVSGLSGAVRMIAVGGFACVLTGGGGIECWAAGSMRATVVAGLGDGVSTVGVGSAHACAVVQGEPKCWGNNDQGQLGDGTRTSRARPVAVLGFARR